jgi:hypothetical protein
VPPASPIGKRVIAKRNFCGNVVMKERTKYCPDLRACVLEDRLLPAVSDLGPGALVLTAQGYVLVMSPFPVRVADPTGASGSPGYLTSSAMIGGVSGLLPASGTGVRPVETTAPVKPNGGTSMTIVVGSGADDASPHVVPRVTRNTIANDAVNATPQIGRLSRDRSEVLPPGQVYRGGVSTDVSSQPPDSGPDQKPAHPLPIRRRGNPHKLTTEDTPAARSLTAGERR